MTAAPVAGNSTSTTPLARTAAPVMENSTSTTPLERTAAPVTESSTSTTPRSTCSIRLPASPVLYRPTSYARTAGMSMPLSMPTTQAPRQTPRLRKTMVVSLTKTPPKRSLTTLTTSRSWLPGRDDSCEGERSLTSPDPTRMKRMAFPSALLVQH